HPQPFHRARLRSVRDHPGRVRRLHGGRNREVGQGRQRARPQGRLTAQRTAYAKSPRGADRDSIAFGAKPVSTFPENPLNQRSMDPITSTAALSAACTRLARHAFVTVDTEFLRESTYYPQLCVVQMATPEDAFVVDALAEGLDLGPFFALM